MNQHLREEEICQWTAGERLPETAEHLRNCIQCRSHITRMDEVLGGLHDSVRDRSEQRIAEYRAFPMGASREAGSAARAWISFGWGKLPLAAVLTLFLAFAVWLPWHGSRSAPLSTDAQNAPAEGKAISSPDDDVALLRRVDVELSRIVPSPLEPLAASIEWRQESKQGPLDGQKHQEER